MGSQDFSGALCTQQACLGTLQGFYRDDNETTPPVAVHVFVFDSSFAKMSIQNLDCETVSDLFFWTTNYPKIWPSPFKTAVMSGF